MGRGTKSENGCRSLEAYSFEEVRTHNKRDDKWLVINGNIYDITKFANKHPGGAEVISLYSGEDATDAWHAFHKDREFVEKYMKPLQIGIVKDYKPSPLVQDFRELREKVEEAGWMKVSSAYFIGQFLSLVAMEIAAAATMYYFGTGWIPYLTAVVLYATCQIQSAWIQHDSSHISIFKSKKLKHWIQDAAIGITRGISSHCWNFRHYSHHAKPNVLSKDPDIMTVYIFLLGDYLPVSWGKRKWGKMPYTISNTYTSFCVVGPPMLLTAFFHYINMVFIVRRKDWWDLMLAVLFFTKLSFIYSPLLGHWGTFCFYWTVRIVESHWFVYVTQMSHIPHGVDRDKHLDWVNLQTTTTSNADPGLFNDWSTGHLNYQIEHHLFPLMPRHNFVKVMPLVKSLCKKHGLPYRCKTLYQSFADIYWALKKSGKLWYEAYYEL